MGRNSLVLEENEMEMLDLFEKAKFLASLWASTDRAFMETPFALIVLNWMDVIGR